MCWTIQGVAEKVLGQANICGVQDAAWPSDGC